MLCSSSSRYRYDPEFPSLKIMEEDFENSPQNLVTIGNGHGLVRVRYIVVIISDNCMYA